MAAPPIASLSALRDLPLRISLPDDLRADIERWFATQAPDDPAEHLAHIGKAEAIVSRAIAYLDSEAARLTQERFATGDANTLRQRLLGDPKRQAEGHVASMKQRVGADRQDWARRLSKQVKDVLEGATKELDQIETAVERDGDRVSMRAKAEWQQAFVRWVDTTLHAWTTHLSVLLQGKLAELLRPDLDALETLVGGRLAPPMPAAKPNDLRLQLPDTLFSVPFEPPSLASAIFETFKNGLNTVAMLAGLIVVPVVGQLMGESPVHVRASVMGGMVAPVLLFAIVAGRRTRAKLHAAATAKGRVDIAKAIDAALRAQIDRYRIDAERYCAVYGQEALQAALTVVEPALQRSFEKREAAATDALASAQLTLDRIGEQLNTIRTVKSGLQGQLLVDLRRRLSAVS